jgi:hypothetical protein
MLLLFPFSSRPQPAQYSFITKWKIKAPLERVWDAIDKGEDWPIWWKGAEQTEIIDNGSIDGTGKVIRYIWKSFLPFTLSFDFKITGRELYKKITGEATGDLEGTGIWTFEEINDITYVQYKWDVISTKKIVNLLSPVLKWFFNYNHNLLMHWGAKGLAKKLHAKLLKASP